MKRFFLLVIPLFMVIFVGSQNPTYYLNPDKKLNQYSIEKWNTENGLPTNSLLHIHQAANGYLWISSYSGLIRFNGSEFKVFNDINTTAFESNVIRNIAEDSQGRIWVTTQGNGLVSIDRNKFVRYGIDQNASNLYRGLLVDKQDRVWAASSEAGWFYLENGELTFIEYSSSLSNIEVRAIVQSKSGAIWFATLGQGLFKYENGILKSYKVEDGLINDWVYSLYVDNSDNLWVGTSSGLCYFDGKRFHRQIPRITSTINKIIQDRFGDLWIGTTDGLFRKKAFTNEVEFIDAENGLPNDFIIDFLFDSEGNLWLTHYKGGLACIKDGKFTNYTNSGGLPGQVVNSIIQKDSNSIMVAFDSGELIEITNGKIKPIELKSKLKGERIRHLNYSENGTLMISTYLGLLSVTPSGQEKWLNESNGFFGTKIRLTFQDRNGNIWVGARNNGLIKIEPNLKMKQFTVDDGLPSNLIMAIDEDKDGNIWVATSEGLSGLCSISPTGVVTAFDEKDGFNSNIVFNITCDENNIIWLATVNGLWAYNSNQFYNITSKNGLKDNSVFDIVEDDLGYCWMPYADGVMKVSKKDLLAVIADSDTKFNCRVFNKYDGLPNSECNPTAQVMKDSEGKLYFSTLDGFSIIDPQNVMINNFIPPVVIEDLKADNQSIPLNSELIFSPSTKRLTFSYAALSLYEPEKIEYEYKLEGFEEEWTKTTERSISYTNLKNGNYEFKVKACNNDGIWNTIGTTVKFTIQTPFIESTAFYILVLVVSFSLVFLIYYWRISSYKKKQEELEVSVADRTKEVTEKNKTLEIQKDEIQKQNNILQIQKAEIQKQTQELEKQQEELKESIQAKDKIFSIISHDLRSPLGNIQNMLNLIIDKGDQFNAEKKGRILENLAEITKSTFYLLDNLLNWSRSQRGLITFDPQMFLVAPLIDEIISLTKPLAQKKEIEVISRIGESDLAFGDVNMVKTVFRNFIENALKFTYQNGKIEISTSVRGEFIEFAVKDDGVGMSADAVYNLIHKREINPTFGTNREKGSGLGLLLCKEFIKRHGGEFLVESELGKGTTTYFTLKRFQI